MEETPKDSQEEEEKTGSVRHWVEDNLRLIISVVIVIALGVTIYSYSQRTKDSTVVFEDKGNTQEQVLVDDKGNTTTNSEEAKSGEVKMTDRKMRNRKLLPPKPAKKPPMLSSRLP
jgi:predicted negative regulator of RcsB-dependent stress response